MIERKITERLLRDLEWSPVIGIIGPRQAGKTTLAKYLQKRLSKSSVYLDLELNEDLKKLEDAQSYLSAHADKTVIIDEIQIRPDLFALLRALVDQNRVAARFILLGSAAPHIVKQNTETLAGRITYHELAPFSYSEIAPSYALNTHWFKGGFPDALLQKNNIITRKWLDDFTETFVQRDLGRLGFQVPAPLIRNMLTMTAHLQGSLLNMSNLANSLGISVSTVSKYLEILEGSFLIRRISPYFKNIGKQLVKSPKIYHRDTGLLHHLLRIADLDQLLGHPIVGQSWEGYVIEQIIREAPEFCDFFFYRTKTGAEIDLVVITPRGKMACLEIKFSVAPVVSKGFYISLQDLSPDFAYIIIPQGESYARGDGTKICTLSDFLTKELPGLADA
jgi:predicted AAA+ superfamily ATPase